MTDVQVRTNIMNGRGDLFICDLLTEYFPGLGFSLSFSFNDIDDDDLFDSGVINLRGSMSQEFADRVHDAIKNRNVKSFSFRSQIDMSKFMLDVVVPLWKERPVTFGIMDLDVVGGLHLEHQWVAGSPYQDDEANILRVQGEIEPHHFTQISVRR